MLVRNIAYHNDDDNVSVNTSTSWCEENKHNNCILIIIKYSDEHFDPPTLFWMPKCHLCPNNFAKYENPFFFWFRTLIFHLVLDTVQLWHSWKAYCHRHYDMLCSSQAYIISDLGRRHFLLNRNNIKYIQIISVILFS
jgi:hypothetical protein